MNVLPYIYCIESGRSLPQFSEDYLPIREIENNWDDLIKIFRFNMYKSYPIDSLHDSKENLPIGMFHMDVDEFNSMTSEFETVESQDDIYGSFTSAFKFTYKDEEFMLLYPDDSSEMWFFSFFAPLRLNENEILLSSIIVDLKPIIQPDYNGRMVHTYKDGCSLMEKRINDRYYYSCKVTGCHHQCKKLAYIQNSVTYLKCKCC